MSWRSGLRSGSAAVNTKKSRDEKMQQGRQLWNHSNFSNSPFYYFKKLLLLGVSVFSIKAYLTRSPLTIPRSFQGAPKTYLSEGQQLSAGKPPWGPLQSLFLTQFDAVLSAPCPVFHDWSDALFSVPCPIWHCTAYPLPNLPHAPQSCCPGHRLPSPGPLEKQYEILTQRSYDAKDVPYWYILVEKLSAN